MKSKIFPIVMMLFIFSAFLFAQDNEADQKQKEAAAKAAAEKQKALAEAQKKAEQAEKKKELEQTKNDIQKLLDVICKALNDHDIDKLIECFHFDDKKYKDEFTERYKEEFKENLYSYKDFKVDKVILIDDLAYVTFSYLIQSNDIGRENWCKKVETNFFKKTETGWRYYSELLNMWTEAMTAMDSIHQAIRLYSLMVDGDLSNLLTKEGVCINKIAKRCKLDENTFKDLQYFDEEDFVVKLKKTDPSEHDTYIVVCRASLGKGRGKSKRGPKFGKISSDSDNFGWTKDYLADYKETLKKENKQDSKTDKEESKPQDKPQTDDDKKPSTDNGELTPREQPEEIPLGGDDDDEFDDDDDDEFEPGEEWDDEEFKKHMEEMMKVSRVIEEIFRKYYSAMKEYKSADILKLYDLSDEDVKKEVTDYYTKLCNDRRYQYKDFDIHMTSFRDKEVTIEFTYMRKSNGNAQTDWEKKDGYLTFKKVNDDWKIVFITLKEKWEEAKNKIKEIQTGLRIYKARNGDGLTDLLKTDWIKVSEIIPETMLWEETMKHMTYFDADDFVIKLKEGSTTEYIVKCDASLGKNGGESKDGPSEGTMSYDSKTKKWTEDYKKAEKKEEEPEKPILPPKNDDE